MDQQVKVLWFSISFVMLGLHIRFFIHMKKLLKQIHQNELLVSLLNEKNAQYR